MTGFLPYFILFAAAWGIINGILHDVFVLRKHKVYDKELMRLLIDGHLLLFGGGFYILSWYGIKSEETWGYYCGILTAIFFLGYCAIIWKMLPSIGTILVNLAALILLSVQLR